jgi:hypothetical protein
MKVSRTTLAISGFTVALAICAGVICYQFWELRLWKAEVYGLAGAQGADRAKKDFQGGLLQLYVIADPWSLSNHPSDEGAFKLMHLGYNPNDGPPGRYSAEAYAHFYNRTMRRMHEHPERFSSSTNAN